MSDGVAPKREHVARAIRAAIVQSDFADGFALIQGRLAIGAI
jgi:hypothetical protein